VEGHTKVFEFSGAHSGGIEELALDGPHVVTCGGREQSLKMWDIEKQAQIREFKGFKNRTYELKASFEDNLLVGASIEKSMKLWDLRSAQCIATIVHPMAGRSTHATLFEMVHIRPNHYSMSSGDSIGECVLWDLRKLRDESGRDEKSGCPKVKTFRHGASEIREVYHDGDKLISAGRDGNICLWKIRGLDWNTPDGDEQPSSPSSSKSSSSSSSLSPPVVHLAAIPRIWCFRVSDLVVVCGTRTGDVQVLDFGQEEEEKKAQCKCLVQ
jgi:WD40 repeat protein